MLEIKNPLIRGITRLSRSSISETWFWAILGQIGPDRLLEVSLGRAHAKSRGHLSF